jgi:hypothetical protein
MVALAFLIFPFTGATSLKLNVLFDSSLLLPVVRENKGGKFWFGGESVNLESPSMWEREKEKIKLSI